MEFWEIVNIRTVNTPTMEETLTQAMHMYKGVNRESRNTLFKLVNRDRAIMDIIKLKQTDRGFMEFLSEVEDQEKLCCMEEGLIVEDLKRMSLLGGSLGHKFSQEGDHGGLQDAATYTGLQI